VKTLRLNSLFPVSLFLCFSVLSLTGCAPKAPPFDGQAAYGELLKQCSFGPRNPGSEGHRACGEYLAGRLRELTDEVVEQRFTHRDSASGDSFELTNYIGIVNPKQGKRVLLAAHWDTRPRADRDPDPANREKPILGANDGASGVSVLLELARMFQKTRPAVGVDIVFFDGEDYGREGELGDYFLGSQYFARHLGPYRPEYGILLDMVGDKDLSIPLEANSLRAAPLVMEKIWKAARVLNVPAFKQTQGPAVSDDHIPLLMAGIPVVDLIDFDYPRWHTLGDTPEATSPASLSAVGRVVALVVYSEK
jgi:hypothetical protein